MLFSRLLRAIRLDGSLYEELRTDDVALAQALAIVVIVVLARLAGWGLFTASHDIPAGFWAPLSLIVMPGIWLFPALSLFFLGGLAQATDPTRGSNRDLLIAAGYSAAPGVLWLLLPIPRVVAFVEWLTFVWVMVSMVFAAKAMLKVSVFKAIMFVFPGLVIAIMLATFAAPSGGA